MTNVSTQVMTIRVTTESPLRIGGLEDQLNDIKNTVVRIHDTIVIPGPSLKGALRNEIERYLISTYSTIDSMKPCLPSTPNNISADELKSLIETRKYKPTLQWDRDSKKDMIKGGACEYSSKEERKKKSKLTDNICPACYLLGSQGLSGFVTIPFLSLKTSNARAEVLPSLSLDRMTKGGRSGANFKYEVVGEGCVFEGQMVILLEDKVRGWNLGNPRQLANKSYLGDVWLEETQRWTSQKVDSSFIIDELIIKRLQSITEIGGFRSKGCGRIKVEVVTEANMKKNH